ncbi:MAG TPA: hypothetical protein HA276_05445, partial [Candidatus Poseidoniaceae archaeon]
MDDLQLTPEAVARVRDRIMSLVPAHARVVEFGHSGLSRFLASHYEYALIDDIEPSEHRDVPLEHVHQSKRQEANGRAWFHDVDACVLPQHLELMLVHHREGSLDAAAVLERPDLLQRARRMLLVSDDGE